MFKYYIMALNADAAAGLMTDGMKTALETAFNSIKADVFDVMGTALPIGLGIAGVFIAIRLGIGFFRSIAN